MLPNIIVIDSSLLEEDETPIKGALIFADCIRVHPDSKDRVIDGLKQSGFPEVTVMTVKEFEEVHSGNN